MRTRSYHIALASVAFALAACGAEELPDTIDRETFVGAYSDLRIAAVETDSGRIAFATRDSILGAFGVTEDDLTLFVEAHSNELEFMRDVWNEVELRMDRGDEIR